MADDAAVMDELRRRGVDMVAAEAYLDAEHEESRSWPGGPYQRRDLIGSEMTLTIDEAERGIRELAPLVHRRIARVSVVLMAGEGDSADINGRLSPPIHQRALHVALRSMVATGLADRRSVAVAGRGGQRSLYYLTATGLRRARSVRCRCGWDGTGGHPCHGDGYECTGEHAKERLVCRPVALAGRQMTFGAYKTWSCEACWESFKERL